jgi:hypothetical protein
MQFNAIPFTIYSHSTHALSNCSPLTHRRVPFATPGSMPYALPIMADYTYTGPGPGRSTPGRRGSSPTQQTPLGLIGQYTDYSERREQHLDLDFSRSLAAFDEEMRPKSARVALFEKSLASPGLTPIPGAHEVCGDVNVAGDRIDDK